MKYRLVLAVEAWAIPLLMVVVGLNQIRLAEQEYLSPWKGGGFGMFATVDSPSMRVLRLFGEEADGTRVEIDPQSDVLGPGTRSRLTVFPRRDALLRASERLVGRELVAIGQQSEALRSRLIAAAGSESVRAPIASLDSPLYRPREASDYDFETVTIEKGGIQAFRLTWDNDQARVSCESLLGPFVSGR